MSSKARDFINRVYSLYDRHFLERDPVQFAHRYDDPRDQEAVALIAALLAFGNAKAIIGSVEKTLLSLGRVLSRVPLPGTGGATGGGPPPARSEASTAGGYGSDRTRSPLMAHRWVSAADLENLLSLLQRVYREYASLEDLFLEGYDPRDHDIGGALHHFSRKMISLAPAGARSRGFRYFFPSPQDGSACKRLNLFLRWMVRKKDGIDLGLWKRVSPSKLIIPLDIHVYHFARRYRVSRYKTANWKMAVEVTNFLRKLDPDDPIKYDFAICHHGMEQKKMEIKPKLW